MGEGQGRTLAKDEHWALVDSEGTVSFVDSFGHIMDGERALRVIMSATIFYNHVTPNEIAAHNDKVDRDIVTYLYGKPPAISGGPSCECVYLLEAVGLEGVYKIGRSTDWAQRLADFEGLPFKVTPIKVTYTDESRRLESWLHTRFANQRINGEWFRFSAKELREALEAMNG